MYRRSATRLAAVVLAAVGAGAAADDLPVRDPTRPPFMADRQLAPAEQGGSLLLLSTSVSDGRASAVINGEVVTVGSRIDGTVVTAIEPGRVTLKRGSVAIVLQLFTPPVKRPARNSS